MEEKEINYIRQLLLELEDYLFSLSWYDGEDRLKTFRDLSNIKSIFQLVPKRYLKLLEGKIYTQQELDRAREEERKKVGKEIVNLFIGINKWMSIQPGLKLEAVTDKVLGDYVSNLLKTKEDEK